MSTQASLVAESGDPQTTIVDQAISNSADLIVMGTHGRRGFKRLLLGSVTEAVLHEAPCPVLTVPPHAPAAASESVTFKRILCPIDFSPSALQALGFALDLARQADGRVTLLHVVEWLAEEEPRASAPFNIRELHRSMVADAKKRLRTSWPESRGRGSKLTISSFLDERIARSFARLRRNPPTSLSWVLRAGMVLTSRYLDQRPSRSCVARGVLFSRYAVRCSLRRNPERTMRWLIMREILARQRR